MSTIADNQVSTIAKLARLSLTDEEKIVYAEQLSTILDYVEKLKEVPTDAIDPTSQVTDQVNALRHDAVGDSGALREALLSLAPDRDGDGYKVQTVLKQ